MPGVAGSLARTAPSSTTGSSWRAIPDPLENTVTVETHPNGFPNDIDDSASAETNLFQPSVDVEKVCEDFSKAGDVLDCTITIENTSSDDSPISRTGPSTTR